MNAFSDMEDDIPYVNSALHSQKSNAEILKLRGFTRGTFLLVTYIDGKTLRSGTHTYRYVRAVKGDLSTIIVRDPETLKDFRLNLHTAEVVLGKRVTKRQSTRMLLIECAHANSEWEDWETPYKLRGSRTALESNGLPICPVCGNRFELVETGTTGE